MKKLTMLVSSLALVSTMAFADKTEDATKLVNEAYDYCNANGKEACVKAINAGTYNKYDLYVFAFDMKGAVVAHGAKPELTGKDLSKYTWTADFAKTASAGEGWVDYPWLDKPKTSFVKGLGDYLVGAGFYK